MAVRKRTRVNLINHLPQACTLLPDYYRNIEVLAIFYDKINNDIFVIPSLEYDNENSLFQPIENLNLIASGISGTTSLTTSKAEQLIKTYGINTLGRWIEIDDINYWSNTYNSNNFFNTSISLDQILNNLNREIL